MSDPNNTEVDELVSAFNTLLEGKNLGAVMDALIRTIITGYGQLNKPQQRTHLREALQRFIGVIDRDLALNEEALALKGHALLTEAEQQPNDDEDKVVPKNRTLH